MVEVQGNLQMMPEIIGHNFMFLQGFAFFQMPLPQHNPKIRRIVKKIPFFTGFCRKITQ